MTAPALQRLPDWPERLADYLAAMRPHRFAWGTHDCVRFAAGAIAATTGRQVLQWQWANMADAARLLRRLGPLPVAVGAVLPALASPALAQRGDIVLMQAPVAGGRAVSAWLAVADGAYSWAPGPSGLCSGPMEHARQAWGVGHA